MLAISCNSLSGSGRECCPCTCEWCVLPAGFGRIWALTFYFSKKETSRLSAEQWHRFGLWLEWPSQHFQDYEPWTFLCNSAVALGYPTTVWILPDDVTRSWFGDQLGAWKLRLNNREWLGILFCCLIKTFYCSQHAQHILILLPGTCRISESKTLPRRSLLVMELCRQGVFLFGQRFSSSVTFCFSSV